MTAGTTNDLHFWQHTPLSDMSRSEWESLCDGCGKCCLHKLEDEDTGEVYYTQVACRLLDLATCQCSDYSNRLQRVPECLNLRPADLNDYSWLPGSCAYRLVAEGKPLPEWHHLISGDKDTIHQRSKSVKGKVLSEADVAEADMEEHIVHWVE